jgi:Ribbon-helix-helix protein, copG family
MSTARVYQGGRPRRQGWEEDPLVTVSLHLRKRQLAALDQLADAVHTSRAALVREAIDGLLTHLQRLSSSPPTPPRPRQPTPPQPTEREGTP